MPEPFDKEYEQAAWVLSRGQRGIEPGSFRRALLEALARADASNVALLRRGFPAIVDGWQRAGAELAGAAAAPAEAPAAEVVPLPVRFDCAPGWTPERLLGLLDLALAEEIATGQIRVVPLGPRRPK